MSETTEAGREMDARVCALLEPKPATAPGDVLDRQLAGGNTLSPLGFWTCTCRYDEGDVPRWRPVPVSTEIAAAWGVVEAMHAERYEVDLDFEPAAWRCSFDHWAKNGGTAYADTAPLAICRAALAVLDGQPVGDR